MKIARLMLIAIVLVAAVVAAGSLYRTAAEHPQQPIACPLDAKVCPDGTAVGRTGQSCTFPACPPPNVSLDSVGIAFSVPDGFTSFASPDPSVAAAYETPAATSTDSAPTILIREYPIAASSTALDVIQATAIGGASGAPVPATAYSSAVLGSHRFTVVSIERFEGVVDDAYYLARDGDVLRFDAIDFGADWTNPSLDADSLPAHAALEKLLATLQGGDVLP